MRKASAFFAQAELEAEGRTRRINAQDGAARHARRDLRRRLAVAAADVKNLLISPKDEMGSLLPDERLLQARLLMIVLRVPFHFVT